MWKPKVLKLLTKLNLKIMNKKVAKEQKEQKAEMALTGKSLWENAGQKKTMQKEGKRLSIIQI